MGVVRKMKVIQHLTSSARIRWKQPLQLNKMSAALCGIVGLAMATPTMAEEKGAINWSITPYVWATETTVDLTADGTPIGGGKVSFSDLVDTTDAAFQIHVEGGRSGGNWSAFVDATFLDTSDSIASPAVQIDTDSEQWFVDTAIAYWPQGEAGGLNVFGGIRYTKLEDEFKFILPGTGVPLGTLQNDRSFTDMLLGGRYRFDLNERWSLLTHADYAFGDSDGIFQLQAGFRYAVGRDRQNGILIGYRYKEAKLEDGGVEEEFEFKGPTAAFNFRF